MSQAPQNVEDRLTPAALASRASAGARRATRRPCIEWLHRGVLQLAPGPHSDYVRHLFLRAYAVNVKEETAAIGGRVVLLDDDAKEMPRAGYLLPVCRPSLSALIFDEGAAFEETAAWPAGMLPVLSEKGSAARLHVIEDCGEVHADAMPPAGAAGEELAASARFLDLERAELALVVWGWRYEIGALWLERVR